MIDLSDGLSRDIHQICNQSRVGAVLFADEIPVHEDTLRMRRDGRSALEHALHDGEDHELLFTTSDVIPFELPGIFIGVTTAEPGVRLRTKAGDQPLEPRGWEHKL
jgi:thiamine-monophosphate kinase